MRLTNKLYAQHIGWMFKKHWLVQGKRTPTNTGAAAVLEKMGIKVNEPEEILNPKIIKDRFEVVGYLPKEVPEDETHPNWHSKAAHVFGNENVLLEGVSQAQLLTKTIEISGFPKNVEEVIMSMKVPSTVERSVQNSIMSSHVYDAEQVKLPKIKLPGRPAYNLPREYGISHERRFRLLISKLIFECEKLAGRSLNIRRKVIDNADFRISLPREDDIIQFNVNVEKMITSQRPLEPVKSKYEGDLPNLYPMKCTITIPRKNIYTTDTQYPFSKELPCSHPHTLFLHFDKEFVKNLHETEVTTTQFQSRTLLKAFSVAAARAKQLYGEDALKNIPKPIVVQCVQTDGRSFHFGVFQLNTLILDNTEGLKNYWFHEPNMDLFTECGYKVGRPSLEGYNKDVFRCLNAFYKTT